MDDTQTKTTTKKDRPDSSKVETRSSNADTRTAPLPGFDTMQAFRQGALNLEHWISTSQDLTRFASYRIRKNLETIDAIAKCRTSEDFISAVARAASDTVHDYANEYDRVLAINLASAQ
ncbi:hypothetical protein [Henriciella sp.]|uniref:hypothetical protein n=1 Tax=Henriciella sp. TaxID=1968823 RepID=UPI00262E584B|nr:hypothetical protein [Henriciella sp.]